MGDGQDDAVALRGLADLNRVVHEPARLAVMMVLYGVREADFTFLLNATGLTWGNLSSHLSTLERAGYVVVEKGYVGKKPRTLVRVTAEGRQAVDAYRRTMQAALRT